MNKEAEEAKARVLMDWPKANASSINGVWGAAYMVLSENEGPYETPDEGWLSADLENNKRIVREKWPKAHAGISGNDCAIFYGLIGVDQSFAYGENKSEAWLNARKIVRGEA